MTSTKPGRPPGRSAPVQREGTNSVKPQQPSIWLVALALSTLLLIAACAGSIQTMTFGTGGSPCHFANQARTFSTKDDIQMAAVFNPPPSQVTVTLDKDGAYLDSNSVTLEGSNNCVGEDLGALYPGHYKMTVTSLPASGMPPLSGEFDVTP
jgi:hypothetical protein